MTTTDRLPTLPDDCPQVVDPLGDLLASLAVTIGLPLVILAGVVADLRPSATTGPAGSNQPPALPPVAAAEDEESRPLKWTPEMSAMKAVADAAERRSALMEAQMDRLMEDLRKARDAARKAKVEQAEQEIGHRERMESVAYQVAGMTQRIADGRDTASNLRTELAERSRRVSDLETLGTNRAREIERLGTEVTAWTDLGRSTQTRLVAAQHLAETRARDLSALSAALAGERADHAQTRSERQQAQALADQRMVQIDRLEAASRTQQEEARQLAARRDQRIGALERALEQSEASSAAQAKRLAEAEATIRSLQDAVKSLSAGLVPAAP